MKSALLNPHVMLPNFYGCLMCRIAGACVFRPGHGACWVTCRLMIGEHTDIVGTIPLLGGVDSLRKQGGRGGLICPKQPTRSLLALLTTPHLASFPEIGRFIS
jgi:hypothetical protein